MPYSTKNLRTTTSAKAIILIAFMCVFACTPNSFSDDTKIEKIAVIGASASAGFGIVEKIMISEDATQLQAVSLTDVLKKASQGEEVVVLDLSSGGFFARPIRYGQASVTRANEWNADLVVGIDFLFWFLYGSGDLNGDAITDESARLTKLEEGLRQLGELKAPLIVGEVPDMSPAVGKMLIKSQMPDLKTIEAANKRIHEWAETRPNVGVLPLFDLITSLRSGKPFEIGKHHWDPSKEGVELILPDRLHPSLEGLVALLQAFDDTAAQVEIVSNRMPEMELDHVVLVERVRRGDLPVASPDEAAVPSGASSEAP